MNQSVSQSINQTKKKETNTQKEFYFKRKSDYKIWCVNTKYVPSANKILDNLETFEISLIYIKNNKGSRIALEIGV